MSIFGRREAKWAGATLVVATLVTLVFARVEMPIFFRNAALGDLGARVDVGALSAMPVLAGLLTRFAFRGATGRLWWVGFGVLFLAWACLSFLTLTSAALGHAIDREGLVP